MKRSLLLTIPLFYAICVLGQQDPQYTQFMFNKQQYNPAFIGFHDFTCLSILGRKQYANYKDQTLEVQNLNGKPIQLAGDQGSETFTFAFGMPLYIKNGIKQKRIGGLGASMYSDKVGYVSTNYYKAGFSVKRMLHHIQLGLGLHVGAMQKVIDLTGLKYKHPNDPKIPNLVNTSSINPNVGVGFWLNIPTWNNLSVGYAAQNLAGRPFTFANINALAPGWHQYINVEASFDFIVPIRPYLLVKASQQKTLFQGNNTADKAGFANPDLAIGLVSDISQRFEVGIGMRASTKTFESFNAILGMYLTPQLRLGYAYDMNATSLTNNHNNTHELSFNYCFGKQRLNGDDPRHLGRDALY